MLHNSIIISARRRKLLILNRWTSRAQIRKTEGGVGGRSGRSGHCFSSPSRQAVAVRRWRAGIDGFSVTRSRLILAWLRPVVCCSGGKNNRLVCQISRMKIIWTRISDKWSHNILLAETRNNFSWKIKSADFTQPGKLIFKWIGYKLKPMNILKHKEVKMKATVQDWSGKSKKVHVTKLVLL